MHCHSECSAEILFTPWALHSLAGALEMQESAHAPPPHRYSLPQMATAQQSPPRSGCVVFPSLSRDAHNVGELPHGVVTPQPGLGPCCE